MAAETRKTELADPKYRNIAELGVRGGLTMQWEAQVEAVMAIQSAIPQIEKAVLASIFALMRSNGRLIYVGAGTSGRLGIQDGVELTPTFSWPKERRVYLMAGGDEAVFQSVEGAEDRGDIAFARMEELQPGPHDVVICIAASGTTPFAIEAAKTARAAGAVTIGIANNANAPLLEVCEFPIFVDTGSEPIAGSTRFKAGSAQKNVLNMLSNQIMMGLNKVYKGLMIDMQPMNSKLKARAQRMTEEILNEGNDAPPSEELKALAKKSLELTDHFVAPAVLVALGTEPHQARSLLEQFDNHLGQAIRSIQVYVPAAE